jgi:hypothetical protein
MSSVQTFDLGARRGEWADWLKGHLRRAGRQQKDVAIDIATAVGDGCEKGSAVNRFVKGDPAELRKWFEEEREWIEILLQKTGLSIVDLNRRLGLLRTGAEVEGAWHPAFLGVTLDEVAIPCPLRGVHGRTQPAAAAKEHSPSSRPLVLAGRTGRSRDLAVQQLQAAAPELTIEVVEPGGRDRVDFSLAEWGPDEAVALARRLAGSSLEERARGHLLAFAERVEQEPDMVPHGIAADLLIWQLSGVARSGCPSSVAQARRQLTRGAWERATTGAERLVRFDERLLERLFARLAARERGATEPGPWTLAKRDALLQILGEVMRSLAGEGLARPLSQLLERIAEAGSKSERQAALDAMRSALAADPVEEVLRELIEGRILAEVQGPPFGYLRAGDRLLASVWAARELDVPTTLEGRWALLVDPDWGLVLDEQVRAGVVSFGRVCELLAPTPPELALDAALARLRAALLAPAPPEQVTADWAAVSWAVAHRTFCRDSWSWEEPWHVLATHTIEAISWRYRASLPPLGDDPLGVVSARLAPEARELVRRWAATSSRQPHTPDMVLRTRSPLQDVPEGPTWDTLVRARPELRVERAHELALAGHEGCRRLLSGASQAEQKVGYVGWPRLRLEWASRCGPRGEDGLKIFTQLAKELASDPEALVELLQLARELGQDVAGGAAVTSIRDEVHFGGGGELLPLWFRILESFRMVDELERLARLPQRQLDGATIVFRHRQWVLDTGSLLVRVKVESPEGSRHTQFMLEEHVDRWELIAEQAAVSLHRLRRPEALRGRFREGGCVLPPSLHAVVRRCEHLYELLAQGPAHWEQVPERFGLECIPWEALRQSASVTLEELRESWFHPKALSVLKGVGVKFVHPDLVSAVLGACSLLLHPEQPLPHALEGLARVPDHPRAAGTLPVSQRAAELLLELKDDTPIRVWLQTQPAEESTAAVSARSVLKERLQNEETLDRAWDVFASLEPDEVPRHLEVRRSLLSLGSVKQGRSSPRPFVIAEALATSDPQLRRHLTQDNEASPDWIPVLRNELKRSRGDLRGAARQAAALVKLGWIRAEVRDALLWWMSSPDAFAGGRQWHPAEDGRWLGGAFPLLEACLQCGGLDQGLENLWKRALELPISNQFESPLEAPETCTLQRRERAPWPLDVLADALGNAGRTELVLQAWREPPAGPPTEEGRADRIRMWLLPWWMAHASSEELLARLTFDPSDGYPLADAYEVLGVLLGRGCRDLHSVAERAASLQAIYWLLARLEPERLSAALEARIASGNAQAGELVHLFEDASLPGWEHPSSLVEVRRRLPDSTEDPSM